MFSKRAKSLYGGLLLVAASIVAAGGAGPAAASVGPPPPKVAQGPITGKAGPSFVPPPGARTKANPPIARSTSATTSIGTATYAHGPWRVESGYWFTVEMYCPAGMTAVSGGENNESAGGINLHDSRPRPDGTGWFVLVSNTYPDASQFRSFVVCVSRVESTDISTVNAYRIAPGKHQYSDSVCVPFRKVLGGGGGWHDGSWNEIKQAEAGTSTSNGFTILGRNRDPENRTMSSVAICAERIVGAQKWEKFPGPINKLGPGRMMHSDATCPPGTQMVSGGAWTFTDGPFEDPETPRLTDSYPNGNGWTAWAHTRNQTHGGTIRAYVTCAS